MTQDFEPRGPEGSGGAVGGRPPLAIIGGIAAVVVVGIIIVVVALGGGGDNGGGPASVSSPAASGGLVTPILPTPAGTPVGQGDGTLQNAPQLTSLGAGDRLVISKFGVNAPLTYKTVSADGQMPNPNGADDVAYYNFSAFAPGYGGAPGQGGNSVFAGHVDSGRTACKNGTVPPPCEAVFWDIGKLAIGDEIEVVVGPNTYKYRVSSNAPVHAETGDWESIVAARAQESITLITCGGDFNPTTREYSHRQVVVALRI